MRFLVPARDYEVAAENKAIPGGTTMSVSDAEWAAIDLHLRNAVPGGSKHLARLSSACNDAPFPSWKNEQRPMSVDLDEGDCRALVKELIQSNIDVMDTEIGRKAWELVSALASGAVRGGIVGY